MTNTDLQDRASTMKLEYPSQDAAMRMLGAKVITRVEWSGTPIGTRGTIVDIYEINGAWGVDVRWHRPEDDEAMQHRGRAFNKPLEDGFTMGEIEVTLEILSTLEPGIDVCPHCWGGTNTAPAIRASNARSAKAKEPSSSPMYPYPTQSR